MHYVADYYLRTYQPVTTPILTSAILLGIMSIVLYLLLFESSEILVEMANMTRQGDKEFFPIPIVLALLFSLVHGHFTGQFWDVLGLKHKT